MPDAALEAETNTATTDLPRLATVVAGASSMTMVALCFANGLQGGGIQTFAQSTEALKHAFHIKDVALGVVPFLTAITGNVGAIPVAALCSRYARTRVLAAMFAIWAVLMAVTAAVPAVGIFGFAGGGFVLFTFVRVLGSVTEATDPAVYPLIADYWPVEARAAKVGVFNAGAAIGAFAGLAAGGIIVDNFGWRWAFLAWLPLGLLGAAVMRMRTEPVRGAQDAAYSERLAHSVSDREIMDELAHPEPVPGLPEMAGQTIGREQLAAFKAISRLRAWRLAALGVAVSMIMLNGLQTWGIAYFKRTFGLDGTQAAALAPVLGVGTFAGILGGGYLADYLLRRGVVRARVWVTVVGYFGAASLFTAAFTTTHIVVAAILLGAGSTLAALPTGPQFALLMDVTPSSLRSQASAAANVLMAGAAIGPALVGALSTLFGENLRLALLCVSPIYFVGGALVFACRRYYLEDVAAVVADAKVRTS